MKKMILGLLLAGGSVQAAFNEEWRTAAPNMYGGIGELRTWSAKTLGNGRLSVGAHLRLNTDETVFNNRTIFQVTRIQGANGDIIETPTDSGTISGITDLTGYVNAAFGLGGYFDLGVNIPIYNDKPTWLLDAKGSDFSKAGSAAIGDPMVWGKLQYPPFEHNHIFDMSFFGSVSVPIGNQNSGLITKDIGFVREDSTARLLSRHFSSDPIVGLMMLWTLDLQEYRKTIPFAFNVNYGMNTSQFRTVENTFVLNAAMIYRAHAYFDMFLEYSGKTRFSNIENGYNVDRDPNFGSVGFSAHVPNGFGFKVGVDKSLTERDQNSEIVNRVDSDEKINTYLKYITYASPAWNFHVALSWTGWVIKQDRDQDGFVDSQDPCPAEAEDFDGFEDDDGCPEFDNDKDGIEDARDRCPMKPEDMDNVDDLDGCPDPDNDRDGILDVDDQCPNEPEDMNGLHDEDGCPDSGTDTDMDGVIDLRDRCPEDPEDRDGFEDVDGCPDEDNDQDSILDLDDKCPDVAEAYNNFEDEDGCPDAIADTDGDGIEDTKDSCVNSPEDIDLFEDEDGCPELDNDKDSIPDSLDKCPNVPETYNKYQDEDGCPDSYEHRVDTLKIEKSVTLRGVNFRSGKAKLTSGSYAPLDEVVKSLLVNKDARVEIRGYSDSRGRRSYNIRLSQARAETVKNYLVSQGVPSKQVTARGYGPEDPVGDNGTAEGRAMNRRIEMHRK
jgi:outer membrane protein OmpA-like peptidoglycan-associated protein